MTEYIFREVHYGYTDGTALGRTLEKQEEIVRCRDCKFGVDGGKYCAEGCADSWDWRNVEPDGFCAWGIREAVGKI